MKSSVALCATFAVLSAPVLGATAAAAESGEISDIREQLRTLLERVDRLEQENETLKSENEKLQAQGDYLKAETRGLRKESAVQAADLDKVKGADWAGRVALKGDLRYRHEEISDDTLNAAGVRAMADRGRDRIRARLNVEAKATDSLLVGIGLATTQGDDPRSSNQTLTDVFSRKAIDLDTAFFDWSFARWGHLIGGKMKQPFVKAGQSLFWDNDINPEGLAATFNRGPLFGSAYGFWVSEISGPQTARTSDVMLWGGQLGARLPLGDSNLMLAAHYYDLSAGKGRAPFFAGDPNGNTTIPVGTPPVNVLANNYEVVNLMAEYNTTLAARPLQIWAEVAQNQGAEDLNHAWAGGVVYGKASAPRTWELGAMYMKQEKDSLYAQLIDSDFANGVIDSAGWVLRGGYAPAKNLTLNASYFINDRNIDVPNAVGQTDVAYRRLQLDFNAKF